MSRKPIIILLLLILLALSGSPAVALREKGEALPELTGPTIDDGQFTSSSLKGQPFILVIGTTWCATCGKQSKAINGLRDYLQEKGIAYVDAFVQEDAEKVREYFERNDYQLPDITVLDDGELAKQMNVYLIPRVLLIDENQRVFRDGPDITRSALKKEIEQMLAED